MHKAAAIQEKIGNYRWTICGLLFFATTVNYLDRQTISLLKVDLDNEFHWTKNDYANITVVFQLMYAIGMAGAGRLIDKLGTKIGYALSLFLWSLAAICHAFVRSTTGFLVVRGALGATESGNFPSAIKSVAEWFPKKERAFATGIFNSGTNLGAIIAPLTVPFIGQEWGWRWAFVATGAVGLVWLLFWFWLYEIPQRQRRISAAELNYIENDPDSVENANGAAEVKKERIAALKLLRYHPAAAYACGKFLTDGVWWFYLFWLPDFLHEQYKLSQVQMAVPIGLVYVISSVGSIFGGWLPMRLISNGTSVFRARKWSMLVYAVCALPVIAAQYFGTYDFWIPVMTIGFAAAAHQAWSANIYTTVSDAFPRRLVGSVIGVGGMAGALGGIIVAKSAGLLFDYYKGLHNLQFGYFILFTFCGCAYIVAWLIMHLLVPKKIIVEI
ncbi:MAG TPA: MFS transporter [Chitinophagaceae bacterium]